MTDTTSGPRPVVLCILDGWGERAETEHNAVALADIPTWDRLVATSPKAQLMTHGAAVGLPDGQMGNSEVGHMNLGAGRVVLQDLPRIDAAFADGSLAADETLAEFITALKTSGGACHLMGLLSPGGVHAHQDHIAKLARIVAEAGVPVVLHGFLDGRDTPPTSAEGDVTRFLSETSGIEGFSIGTLSGRYYPMDRDNRWERVERAFLAIHEGQGATAQDALSAVAQGYAADTTDEFILPTVIGGYAGMRDGDGILMANFRADRARELLAAFLDGFEGFQRPRLAKLAARLGMVEYSDALKPHYPALFPPLDLKNVLGQVIADAGLTQLRCAETEKYPHVTFFLNGGREDVFPGEERILVPSPKVATYDLQPEMSAPEVTDKLVAAVESGGFDLVVVNYANGDMVGHTGDLEAAKKAAATVDAGLARLEKAVLDQGGAMIVTADHGNCEMMIDPVTGGPHTAHTLNPVTVLLAGAPAGVSGLKDGKLADVAPTLLALLGLEQPAEMTGVSLLDAAEAGTVAAE